MDVINLKVDIEVLREDILDFMDENETFYPSESKSIISKLEDLRSSSRSKIILVRHHSKDDETNYLMEQEEVLAKIKLFIKESKDVNMKQRLANKQQQMDTLAQQEKFMEFQLDEMTRQIMELEAVFKNFISGAKDEEITRWNAELPETLKTLESISNKYQKVLQVTTHNKDLLRSVSEV